MNRIVILSCAILALGVASCTPRADPLPEEEPVPVAAPVQERFTVTTLTRDSTNNAKVALIVDNTTGCVLSMTAPNAPVPVPGRFGCNPEADLAPGGTVNRGGEIGVVNGTADWLGSMEDGNYTCVVRDGDQARCTRQ
jgi:hypothetical protein